MMRILVALSLLLVALGANAALYFRESLEPAPLTGTSKITLAGQSKQSGLPITVPKALIRDRTHVAGGRLERLDLAVAIADFSPLPQPSPRRPDARLPDRLALILTAATGTAGPADQFQTLYARFLTGETWSNPGGLIMRRFKTGTPYEDREIYIGAGTGRLFIALCPREAIKGIEPCTANLRQDGVDIELRFDARYLPDWRRFTGETTRLIGEWRSGT